MSTRTHIGALTTIFTRPAGCSSRLGITGIYGNNVILHDWDISTNSECYPSRYSTRYGWYDGFYSPGACPHGYTIACTTVPNPQDGFILGESGGLCCPSSYKCSYDSSHSLTARCTSKLTSQTVNLVKSTLSNGTSVSVTVSVAVPTGDTTDALAYGIIIRWQSSDLPILSSAGFEPPVETTSKNVDPSGDHTITPTPDSTPPVSRQTETGEATPPASGGLTSGAKIAIGITIPIVIIGALLAIFLICRARHKRHENDSAPPYPELDDTTTQVTHPTELDGAGSGRIIEPKSGFSSQTFPPDRTSNAQLASSVPNSPISVEAGSGYPFTRVNRHEVRASVGTPPVFDAYAPPQQELYGGDLVSATVLGPPPATSRLQSFAADQATDDSLPWVSPVIRKPLTPGPESSSRATGGGRAVSGQGFEGMEDGDEKLQQLLQKQETVKQKRDRLLKLEQLEEEETRLQQEIQDMRSQLGRST